MTRVRLRGILRTMISRSNPEYFDDRGRWLPTDEWDVEWQYRRDGRVHEVVWIKSYPFRRMTMSWAGNIEWGYQELVGPDYEDFGALQTGCRTVDLRQWEWLFREMNAARWTPLFGLGDAIEDLGPLFHCGLAHSKD